MMSIRALLLIVFSLKNHSKFCVNAIETKDLYPFGSSVGDNRLPPTLQDTPQDDISSNEIKLKTNIKFYSNEYGAIYVSKKQYFDNLCYLF